MDKLWALIKNILAGPLYFLIGVVILFIIYYAAVYIGSDYNSDIIDIEHCRGIRGTWDYNTSRCKL